MLTGLFRIN